MINCHSQTWHQINIILFGFPTHNYLYIKQTSLNDAVLQIYMILSTESLGKSSYYSTMKWASSLQLLTCYAYGVFFKK